MEKREKRERSMGRGDTTVSDSEGVSREKVKGREKKWESLPWEREGTKKLCFPRLETKIIFIEDATREREIVFQIFFFGKWPIEKISLILLGISVNQR